jgi:CheY-like chemotaxis protein
LCEWQIMRIIDQANMVKPATWKEQNRMNSVLILEQDKEVGEALCEILHGSGYSVAVCSDTPLALSMLQVAPSPLAVILHKGSQEEWRRVLAAVPQLPPHAYLILSADSQQAPRQWNPHTSDFVPVLEVPVDVQLLLATIANGAERLYSIPYLMPVI